MHKELSSSRLSCDEDDVSKLVSTIEAWADLFDLEESDAQTLMNLATGTVATPDVQSNLLGACGKGAKAWKTFLANCLKAPQCLFTTQFPL